MVAQLRALLAKRLDYAQQDGESFLDAAQNARLIAAAVVHDPVVALGGAESWNLRDTHMFQTLKHLLDARGPQSKAVVWAHNSHIGDARHTDMGSVRGELNIGQLCRQRLIEPRLERFIGVIYRPETELPSHYAEASLPQQFDAFLWFDETRAVTPLGPQHARPGAPDTYPFAL